ncbi:MAG: hypothetical protein WCP45_05285 [Verrucomicrobiota bacterium]
MNDSPILPAHPLDIKGVMKIRLSAAASDALRGVGEHHLAVISRADCTAPAEAQDRMILHVIELTKELATAVSRVALGTHVARPRPMPAKSATTPASSSASSSASASSPMNSLP